MERGWSSTIEAIAFDDRHQAGLLLGLELERGGALAGMSGATLVVGLARGGVQVAAAVAEALAAPLDALAVRKVGHPWQPEYGLGAVAPGGIRYIRSHDGLTDREIDESARAAEANAEALDARLHERRAQLPVEGRTCVLVDDGLATGGTMVAAARWARARGASAVVVAVPVGADATVRALEQDESVDAIVCLIRPPDFGAVGFWYRDFRQVRDEEVVAMLEQAHLRTLVRREETIAVDGVGLEADLAVPVAPVGWVVFAHGSGSSRTSPRNAYVAGELNGAGIATLLFDLLTREEESDRRNVFDVDLLAGRLVSVTGWLAEQPDAAGARVGYFGASTGAAAALLAAAELGAGISAVVSRGGRPDLAIDRLGEVTARTLLVVGGADTPVLELNRLASAHLTCPHDLAVVPDATHLFDEPGALERVAALASAWFVDAFGASRSEAEQTGEPAHPAAR